MAISDCHPLQLSLGSTVPPKRNPVPRISKLLGSTRFEKTQWYDLVHLIPGAVEEQDPHQAWHLALCSPKRRRVVTGALAELCSAALLRVLPGGPVVAAVGEDVALHPRATAGVARGVLREADVVGDGVLERLVHAC